MLVRSGGITFECSFSAPSIPKMAVKKKALPFPETLSTQILPPIISTRRLLIDNPSPVPPYFLVVDVSAWLNDLNNLDVCSSERPIPVSRTANLISTLVSPRVTSSVETTISPFSVNFTALLQRLIRTCPRRRGSPTRDKGMFFGVLIRNSNCFSAAFNPTTVDTLSSTSSN